MLPPPAELIIVRHGETEWNAGGLVMGWLDSPLSERGEHQCRQLAQRMSRAGLSRIIASDLGRAVKTAAAIGEACGLGVDYDSGLRERNMGIF